MVNNRRNANKPENKQFSNKTINKKNVKIKYQQESVSTR